MKIKPLAIALMWVASLATVGCFGSRYISADADLEEIYVGKSYYEIADDFGRPNATAPDGMGGSKMAYNSVSLNGSRAAHFYRSYAMRNRSTKVKGAPYGGITFMLDANNKCYAVNSDFQRERDKAEKKARPQKAVDKRMPSPVKPKIPRTIDYPLVENCSPFAEVVSIEKVEVEKDKLVVHFRYRARTPQHRPLNDVGVYVMPEVYAEDCATHKRFALRQTKGITQYPERTQFAHNQGGYDVLVYSLVFEPTDTSTEYINIVEPGHSGFNFYGVDIRTPMTTKDELKQL
ncbi:MAG: hypothetical protein IJ761_00115 [Bacteroidales bacterium]|nr:hypothetical protein [Bacteroidales bacterium]